MTRRRAAAPTRTPSRVIAGAAESSKVVMRPLWADPESATSLLEGRRLPRAGDHPPQGRVGAVVPLAPQRGADVGAVLSARRAFWPWTARPDSLSASCSSSRCCRVCAPFSRAGGPCSLEAWQPRTSRSWRYGMRWRCFAVRPVVPGRAAESRPRGPGKHRRVTEVHDHAVAALRDVRMSESTARAQGDQRAQCHHRARADLHRDDDDEGRDTSAESSRLMRGPTGRAVPGIAYFQVCCQSSLGGRGGQAPVA